jgi:hypothetical protein
MNRATMSMLLLVAGVCACAQEPGWQMPNISMTTFEDDVYPVLIRDCAFHTCHGAEERFFRVWGPGRVRLDPTMQTASDPATDREITESYNRALSLIDTKDPRRSLLLRKPLATEAGGAGHLGADKFGRNLYRSVDSDGYVKLSRWVFSLTKEE